jgi:hypothetical protein
LTGTFSLYILAHRNTVLLFLKLNVFPFLVSINLPHTVGTDVTDMARRRKGDCSIYNGSHHVKGNGEVIS